MSPLDVPDPMAPPASPSTTAPASTTTFTTVRAANPLSPASKVSVRGIGDVVVGMDLAQASSVAGFVLRGSGSSTRCVVTKPEGGPAGISITFIDERVARVDVSAPGITTLSGIGVGSTEDQLRAKFGSGLTFTPRSGGGNDVSLSGGGADADKKVVWATDGTKVTAYRAGLATAVVNATACS